MQVNLWIVLLNIGIAALGIGFVYPLIPLLLSKADISPSFIGLTGTLMALAGALAALPAGRLIDRLGSKKVMAAGLGLYAVSMLMFPFFNSWPAFAVLRMLEGAAGAAIWVSTETMINLLSNPANRARNLGFYTTFVGAGFGLGPLFGSFLVRYSVFYAFWACTLVIIAALMVTIFFLADLKGHMADERTGDSRSISSRIRLSLGAVLLYSLTEGSVIALLALYLQELGHGVTATGWVFAFFVLGGVIVPPFTGMLADRHGKEKIIIGALIIVVAVTLIFPALKGLSWILGMALVFGAAMGSIYMAGLAAIGDRVKVGELGTANAIYTTYYGIGGIVGPFLGGLAFQYLGREFLFYEVTVFAILLLAFILVGERKRGEKNGKGF